MEIIVIFDQIEDTESTVADVLGLIGDLLCEDMRLLISFWGARPYRWTTEQFDGTKWVRDHTGGLLFWNYFGRRSQNSYKTIHCQADGNPCNNAMQRIADKPGSR